MNTVPISDQFIQSLGGNAQFVHFLEDSVYKFVLRRSINATKTAVSLHPFVNKVLQYEGGPLPVLCYDQTFDMPLPEAKVEFKSGDPILCLHGLPCKIQVVKKHSSRNAGRQYVRCQRVPRCSFFRWVDELENGMHGPITLQNKCVEELQCPSVTQQLKYWQQLEQGSEEWLAVRSGRITASNFGIINDTNPYSSKDDHLRAMLWHATGSGMAMKWGSRHEELAYNTLCKLLSSPNVWFETAGIWVANNLPYLGASPDGIIYVVQSIIEADDHELLFCTRFLIEIKVPWSLREREPGAPFYKETNLPGSTNTASIPLYYYDQIVGNCNLIGLQGCFFFVLSPTGWQLTYIPNNAYYWQTVLLPALNNYYSNTVQPALREQRTNGLPLGTIPSDDRPSLIFNI